MKILKAIAAEKSTPKGRLLAQRKVICVTLSPDDLDKLQDRTAITINMEELFPEIAERVSIVLCYHDNEEEASKIFKCAFDLIYLDGREV